MVFDINKLMDNVDWSMVDKDYIKIHVDGEKLKKDIYDTIKVTVQEVEGEIILSSNNHDFIKLTPGGVFNKGDCYRLANELKNIINIRLQSKLCLI